MAQFLNLPAATYTPYMRRSDPSLEVPHFSVKNISEINPWKLKERGVNALVFDKDNTLTRPYENEIHPAVTDAFEEFRDVFGDKIVIMSNSAGTGDDRDYLDATEIEEKLGIPVLRHTWKKPAGGDALKKYFEYKGVRSLSHMAMFGDRLLTDIVFGNRYGLLTIHTAIFTEEGDNMVAMHYRRGESARLQELESRGIRAPPHRLYDEAIIRSKQ